MAIKTKNPADLTEEEIRMVQRIIVLCVAKLHSFLTTHKDPKKFADYLIKSSGSRKEHFLVDLVLRAMSMPAKDLLFPQDLNKKVTERIRNVILDLEIESPMYFKSWEVTEALQELESHIIFENLRGKKVLKSVAPGMLRLKKGAGYENSRKKEGFYSGYRVTENLATLNKVIANPKALEIIHKELLDLGVLEKFYFFVAKAVLYAMKIGDESMFGFAAVGAQAILDENPKVQTYLSGVEGLADKQIEYPYWKAIQKHLNSLSDEELDKMMEDMIKLFIKNPIDHNYVLLALSEL